MLTQRTNELSLAELRQLCQVQLASVLKQYIDNIPYLELKSPIEYSLQNKGKLLRPLLIYATGNIFATPLENLAISASAIELIHTYSLIHDDLPCMDNADLRRGKPTCHKVYGEHIAVLTGDALFSLAMQIIASHPASLTPEQRLQMITLLSKAAGPYGMVAGQVLDISSTQDNNITSKLLEDIYRYKTGALFSACIELAYIASTDVDEDNQHALTEFGKHIGVAFQIQDDILDIETATGDLGKPQHIDTKNNKITYPHLLGLERAKEKVQSLYEDGLTTINYLGQKAQLLRDLTRYMLQRKK